MITSTPAVGQVWLCENQTSIVVTGIDHWVWTAYGIVDTYIGSKESLMHYDEQSDQSGQVDPLSKGQLHAHPLTLIWTPREYFLAIVAIRMNEALRAWRETINVVEDIVKQARTNHVISKPSDDASRQAALNYSNWCNQLIQLLKLLINSLSDTVATWDEFQRGEIGYFDDGEAKSPLTKSMFIVKKKFSDLKEILRKLRDLELQLCADSPQGLHAHLGFGNQDVAIAQQRDAYRMQVFTVVAMLFLPLSLTSSLFSTPGVLPFIPNTGKFIVSWLVLAGLVIVAFVVLLNWESWFRPFQRCFWKREWMVPPQQCDPEKGLKEKHMV